MSAVITILLVLFAVVVMTRAISRAKEQAKGHNRCEYCRTHLRRSADATAFATVCRKCGREQSWA